jgi:hypothetical protein
MEHKLTAISAAQPCTCGKCDFRLVNLFDSKNKRVADQSSDKRTENEIVEFCCYLIMYAIDQFVDILFALFTLQAS